MISEKEFYAQVAERFRLTGRERIFDGILEAIPPVIRAAVVEALVDAANSTADAIAGAIRDPHIIPSSYPHVLATLGPEAKA